MWVVWLAYLSPALPHSSEKSASSVPMHIIIFLPSQRFFLQIRCALTRWAGESKRSGRSWRSSLQQPVAWLFSRISGGMWTLHIPCHMVLQALAPPGICSLLHI